MTTWKVFPNRDGITKEWTVYEPIHGETVGRYVALVDGKDRALLIAASPDLLDFAKDVHAYLDALPNLPDNDELAQLAGRAEALIKAAG